MKFERKVLQEATSKFPELASAVIDDPRFAICSGSSYPEHHHYGEGGLLQHTCEVMELCLRNYLIFHAMERRAGDLELNREGFVTDLAFAVLYHDAGKMWDYEKDPMNEGAWRPTSHKEKIHHISRSSIYWEIHAYKYNYPPERMQEVTHAILSHHGQRAWGSPVTPKTKLAWLLHLCDGLSARMDDCHLARDKP